MPPTPYKRDRRYKTRMNAGSDSERANLREKALKLARSGLNRRGGPVDQGSPDAQKAAAESMRGPSREVRNDRVKAGLGLPQLNRNKNSPRFGQRYRSVPRAGGVLHDYAGTKNDVFVRKPESGGTGNHPPKGVQRAVRTTENVNQPTKPVGRAPGSTYDRMAADLAKQRATQDRPKAKRRLFASTASYRPDTGQRRRRRLVGLGVGSSSKRQYI